MKVFILFFALCTVTTANAGMYKCITDGKVSYQSSPCPTEEAEAKFSIKYDISKEQIQVARDKKEAELTAEIEQNKLDRIAYDKERIIRSKEKIARESVLQTDAMRERNDIERNNSVHTEYDIEHINQYSFEEQPASSNHDYIENHRR